MVISKLTQVFVISVLLTVLIIIGSFVVYNKLTEPENMEFDITAEQFKFTPDQISVNKGDNVTLKIRSLDVLHGIYIDGYEIFSELPPLKTIEISFIADKTGKFTLRCAIPCGNFHPYMIGELSVQPNLIFYASIGIAGVIVIGIMRYWFMKYRTIAKEEDIPSE